MSSLQVECGTMHLCSSSKSTARLMYSVLMHYLQQETLIQTMLGFGTIRIRKATGLLISILNTWPVVMLGVAPILTN